jgi:hypothetical protein
MIGGIKVLTHKVPFFYFLFYQSLREKSIFFLFLTGLLAGQWSAGKIRLMPVIYISLFLQKEESKKYFFVPYSSIISLKAKIHLTRVDFLNIFALFSY